MIKQARLQTHGGLLQLLDSLTAEEGLREQNVLLAIDLLCDLLKSLLIQLTMKWLNKSYALKGSSKYS